MGHEILTLLNDPTAVKILVTTSHEGDVHAAVKSSLHYADGALVYWELLESSNTHRNLTDSLWFNRKATVLFLLPDGRSWRIPVGIRRAIVSGRDFGDHYRNARARFGDVDLAAAWILEPEEPIDQTLAVRLAAETRAHPYFTHLDRLARQGDPAHEHA